MSGGGVRTIASPTQTVYIRGGYNLPMPTVRVIGEQTIRFVDDQGDDVADIEWNENERRVDISDPTTGAAVSVDVNLLDGSVGLTELADALGTNSNNKIPGESYFEDANVEALEAGTVQTSVQDSGFQTSGGANDATGKKITLADFDSSQGWLSVLRFDHKGGVNGFVMMDINIIAATGAAAGVLYDESDSFVYEESDSGWGASGTTQSITSNQRLRVGDDNTELFYEIDVVDVFQTTIIELLVGGSYTSPVNVLL
jgi:hypothetical protein